ncbi:MAG: hypothetical protein ACHQIM_18300 [Sphingobacteriales bacterium]
MESTTEETTEDKSLLKLRFQPKTLERIDKLRKVTKIDNRAQLVASSLQLTDELLDIIKNGSKIYIEKPDGTKALVNIFGF